MYELWDSDTGNRVGKYSTEEAALGALLEDIRLYGRDAQAVLSLGLLQRDPVAVGVAVGSTTPMADAEVSGGDGGQAAGRSRALSNLIDARPGIWRFRYFSRLICPSV